MVETKIVTATPVPPTPVPPPPAPKAADTVIVAMDAGTRYPASLHRLEARVDVLAPVMGASLGAGNGCMGQNEKASGSRWAAKASRRLTTAAPSGSARALTSTSK